MRLHSRCMAWSACLWNLSEGPLASLLSHGCVRRVFCLRHPPSDYLLGLTEYQFLAVPGLHAAGVKLFESLSHHLLEVDRGS